MPTTSADRILAGGTLVCTAVLLALVAVNWHLFQTRPASSPTATQGPRPAATKSAREHASRAAAGAVPQPDDTRAQPVSAAAEPDARVAPIVLEVGAAGGATWLEVRAGGAAGEQLHFGMLQPGERRAFERLPVWVRAGAAEHLVLRLAGSRAHPPPAAANGVVEFLVSAAGIAPA